MAARLQHAMRMTLVAIAALAIAVGCLGACAPRPRGGRGSTPASTTPDGLADVHDTSIEDREKLAADAARQAAREEKAQLDDAISEIEASGAQVSYVIVDLASGSALEYQADIPYYSASTIKAPFCISLVRAQGPAAKRSHGQRITACLADSDNEAYRTLRSDLYGQQFFADFCREAGVPCDLEYWYADYSVRQLAALWQNAWPWLESDDAQAAWLSDLLADTLQSRVDDLAPSGSRTWSKAGWYAGGGPAYDVTFDAGIIEGTRGACVIAVATNRGSDFSIIERVMGPLVELWDAGGVTDPAE